MSDMKQEAWCDSHLLDVQTQDQLAHQVDIDPKRRNRSSFGKRGLRKHSTQSSLKYFWRSAERLSTTAPATFQSNSGV